MLLNQILEDPEFPHVTKLESCVDEDQLKNICDVTSRFSRYSQPFIVQLFFVYVSMYIASTAVTSGPLFRYNEDKTLAWLKKKVCTYIKYYIYMSSYAWLCLIQIDKLVMTLQEERVEVGGGSKSQLLKRNSTQRASTGNESLRTL